jgi:spermidine synthase
MGEGPPRSPAALDLAVLGSVFAVGACGIVYELLAATAASYVLGNAVVPFSTVIGVYLAAMGLGALRSERVTAHVAARFIEVELALAAVGGALGPALLSGALPDGWFSPTLYLGVAAAGALVGMELPLLVRLLSADLPFSDRVGKAFFADYAGALVASVLFPRVMVPALGLWRTGLLAAAVNALVALGGTFAMQKSLGRKAFSLGAASVGLLVALLWASLRGGPAGGD